MQTFQPLKPPNLEVWKMYMKKLWDLGLKRWDFTKMLQNDENTTKTVLTMFKLFIYILNMKNLLETFEHWSYAQLNAGHMRT